MKRYLILLAALSPFTAAVQAATDITDLHQLTQTKFKSFSEDVGGAFSYRSTSPAEPLGITGFDLGIEMTRTSLPNSDDWAAATSDGKSLDYLVFPKLHVHKGLPFGIDVGAFYTSASNSDVQLTGAELKYAIIKGGVAVPAVAVRATYSKLSGIDQLDLDTKGVELSISKGVAMVTPYAGVGTVWVTSTPKEEAVTIANLEKEEITLGKYFAGINLNMGLMNLAVEGDKTGEATAYTVKLGFRW